MINSDSSALATDIPFTNVAAALNLLGIPDHRLVGSVHIDPHHITVVRHKLNENGSRYLVDDVLATETETITIRYAETGA